MKNKKLLWIIVSTIISIFILCVFIFISTSVKKSKSSIYQYNELNNELIPYKISLNLESETFVEDIFKALQLPPPNIKYVQTIPNDIKLLNYNLEKNTLSVNLSNDYNSLSNSQKIILKTAFVHSIIQNSSIKNIKFCINSIPLPYVNYFNADNSLIEPILSPDKTKTTNIKLYFSNKDNSSLVPEYRIIQIIESQSKELQILEQLIIGPRLSGKYSLIPTETKIRNVKTQDGICYVDLSKEFIEKNKSVTSIYSVVNSLTELEYINKVQFLIDGKKIDMSYNDIDIKNPIGRNESIISKK